MTVACSKWRARALDCGTAGASFIVHMRRLNQSSPQPSSNAPAKYVQPDIPIIVGTSVTGSERQSVEDDGEHGGAAIAFHHRQHAHAGALVVLAIQPRDGVEVRELPQKHDGEQHEGFSVEVAANGGPAQHRRHGSRKCAEEGTHRVHHLHRAYRPSGTKPR